MFSTAFLDLPPLAAAAGTVRLPGSKSISNRVLLLAALCERHHHRSRPARLRRHARDARCAARARLRHRIAAGSTVDHRLRRPR
jgi:5-enolpyruvylshikimate-3-phosphate synthase